MVRKIVVCLHAFTCILLYDWLKGKYRGIIFSSSVAVSAQPSDTEYRAKCFPFSLANRLSGQCPECCVYIL